MTHASSTRPIVLTAEDLGFAHPGQPVFAGLSFTIGPGLTFVRGGEGRGKTSLLRLMAGTLEPASGRIVRHTESVCFDEPADPAHDQTVVQHWLDARRERFPAWQHEVATALIDAFALTPHIAKPMFMLSTGSRRKVGLVVAAASGAALTLVDMPFAALDGASRGVVCDLLADAAEGERAWVMADHELAPCLEDVTLAATLDLGDDLSD